MDAIDKKCLELLEKCMEKKMSVDTIVQVVNVSYLQEEKADYILNELLKIVDKSTEIQLRQKLSDLLVC